MLIGASRRCAAARPASHSPSSQLGSRQAVHDRGGLRRMLGPEGEGIGLQRQQVAVRAADLELVRRARADAGQEDLPHADAGMQPHRVQPAVPVVELADHGDAAGVRRPDGEDRAVHPVQRPRMGAEPLVQLEMRALAEQMQVDLAEAGREAVGVLDLPHPAGRAVIDAQPVARREGPSDRGRRTPRRHGAAPAGPAPRRCPGRSPRPPPRPAGSSAAPCRRRRDGGRARRMGRGGRTRSAPRCRPGRSGRPGASVSAEGRGSVRVIDFSILA